MILAGAVKNQNLYLLHALRRRMEYPELKRAVREQATRFNVTTVLIEDKSSGTELIQELKRDGLHGSRHICRTGTRLCGCTR